VTSQVVDTLIIVSNDRLLQIIPENTPLQKVQPLYLCVLLLYPLLVCSCCFMLLYAA
jgi:hypothetical protein